MAKGRVTRDDWTMAALRALARGGVPAVAVDVLAKELEVSRGSFYWHFKNREALLVAALETWERHATTDVVATVRAIDGGPRERARALLTIALGTEEIAGLEPALATQAAHPAVAEVTDRVTRARLAFLTELAEGIGLTSPAARHRALACYAAYLGWLELRRTSPTLAPELTPDHPESEAALDHLVTLLMAPADR